MKIKTESAEEHLLQAHNFNGKFEVLVTQH